MFSQLFEHQQNERSELCFPSESSFAQCRMHHYQSPHSTDYEGNCIQKCNYFLQGDEC